MIIIATSDTHYRHEKVELAPGDVFIHAGDNNAGGPSCARDFIEWVGELNYKHKIIIAGNHDNAFADDPKYIEQLCKDNGVIYLNDSGVEIDGVKFWGSPWTPKYGLDIYVFNAARSVTEQAFLGFKYPLIEEKWALIPEDTDVLITHGPAYDVLDVNKKGIPCGCVELRKAIEKIKPQVHIFGHIHEGAGDTKINETEYYNVAYFGKITRHSRNEYTIEKNPASMIYIDDNK